MIEARAAQKLGRSVAVARVLPPSLLSLPLTNREDIACPGGRKRDPPILHSRPPRPPQTEASPSPLSTTEIKALDNAALVPSRFTFM